MGQMFSLTEKDEARFWAKVQKSAGCWEWTSQCRDGYGLFSLQGKPVSAHRVSFFLANGEFDGDVLHTCDNPPCVRPEHLFNGTHQDNMDDMYAKGRRDRKQPYQPKEFRKIRKLSHEQVAEILEALKTPYHGQVNFLAKKYGVNHSMISHIKGGRFIPVKFSISSEE